MPTAIATPLPDPLSRVMKAIVMAMKATIMSTTGITATREVRTTVPITAGTRAQARRQMMPKVVGRPRTASCRTAGTVAYIIAVAVISTRTATSQTAPKAITSGTMSSVLGLSSEESSMTRCRGSLTAEYAIATAAPTTTSAPPYTATPTPNSCFQ